MYKYKEDASLKAITDGHLAKVMEHGLESASESRLRYLQLTAHSHLAFLFL